MSTDAAVTVTDNPDASRYEASDDSGVVAGFAEYIVRDGVVIFTHTEVDPAFEGQGVGSTLAQAALDDMRDKNATVRPACSFIRAFIDSHPEYRSLLPS